MGNVLSRSVPCVVRTASYADALPEEFHEIDESFDPGVSIGFRGRDEVEGSQRPVTPEDDGEATSFVKVVTQMLTAHRRRRRPAKGARTGRWRRRQVIIIHDFAAQIMTPHAAGVVVDFVGRGGRRRRRSDGLGGEGRQGMVGGGGHGGHDGTVGRRRSAARGFRRRVASSSSSASAIFGGRIRG